MLPKSGESLRKIAPFLNIGTVFAGCVGIGVLLGWWLDRWLGTKPWLFLTCSLLGIVSGFYHFFKVVLSIGKDQDRQDED